MKIEVLNPLDNNERVEINQDLLKDFFDEAFVYEKDLLYILGEYSPEARDLISRYIIYRLAEVSPGYLPNMNPDYEP